LIGGLGEIWAERDERKEL